MSKRSKIWVTLAVVVVVLIVVAVTAWLVLNKSTKQEAPATSDDQPYSQSTDPQLTGELGDAKKKLDTAKGQDATLSGNKELARAYIEYAMAQYNVEDYKGAVKTYELLESEVDSFKDEPIKQDILRGLYTSYAHAGERDKAIATCERLIQYLKTDSKNPYVSGSIDAYSADLATLKEGGEL